MPDFPAAPPWQVDTWFNTPRPLALDDLRGKVVVLEAFQMLCPGCVAHGLPQAGRVHDLFPPDAVAVVGLHTVFEHHAAMTPVSLQAFLHEYRIRFPVGVDVAGGEDPIPLTMRAYGMRGTPTLVMIDARGRIRHHHFGRVDDVVLGAQIATLVSESARSATPAAGQAAPAFTLDEGCDDDGCRAPQRKVSTNTGLE